MSEERSIARQQILNYVMMFCTKRVFGTSYQLPIDEKTSFRGNHSINTDVPINSLVSLSSAPYTKYYLSWLREIKPNDGGYTTQFLLESIEDGSLCWWENVSLWALPKETTDEHPEWQWTDKQFAFKNKWFNACYKKRDAYIILPCWPEFTEDGGVILKLRTRFGINDKRPEMKFDNWRKLLVKEMLGFYDNNQS